MSTVKTNNVQIGQSVTATNNGTWYQPATPDGTIRYGIGNAGATTSDVVTLTSAGNVGIGTNSPATKLHVSGTGSTPTLFERTGSNGVYLQLKDASGSSVFLGASNGVFAIQTPGSSYSDKLVVDSSGNLGLGVTPSGSQLPTLQFGSNAIIASSANTYLTANAYYNSGWKYVASSQPARMFSQDSSGFIWYTAPSGTAGNAISWTQAMTLDASGVLSNVSYIKAGTYLWAAGDTSSGGIYLGSAGSNNARIGQNSQGTGTTTTYIGNAAITTSSDVRLKENIEDTKRNAIEILGNLRVVDHTWNDPTDTCENNRNSRGVWMGLIAQEAIDHIPWLVNKPLSDEDERGNPQYWHMDYGYSVPLLIKAIQELSAELNELKQKVNA